MNTYSHNIMADCFIAHATYSGSRPCIIVGERRITWGEFIPRTFRIANALIQLGVKPGDTVAFMFHNTPEFLEVNAGIQVAGAIPVPMNYRYIVKEIIDQGNHCDAHVFIYDTAFSEKVAAAAPHLNKIAHFICHGPSTLSQAKAYEDFVHMGEPADPNVATTEDDVAVMIYTGGTTGLPKGVLLTYGAHMKMFARLFANILAQIATTELSHERAQALFATHNIPLGRIIIPLWQSKLGRRLLAGLPLADILDKFLLRLLSNPDIARRFYRLAINYSCPSMPLFHDAGYAFLMLGMMTGLMTYVLYETVTFDPTLIFKTIARERIRYMSNVPTGWQMLVDHPDAHTYNLSSIMVGVTGGGVCSAPLKKKILQTFRNVLIVDVFGQTEMTPATSYRIDLDPQNLKDQSVGKAIVKMKIVDETGRELSPGQVGEICYQAPWMMKGYYKDADKTTEVMNDGWFKSGDLGYLDEAGEIRPVDRKNECINTGGEKVFPREVEDVILNHPKVHHACVIGVPDAVWGNAIRAVVELLPEQAMNPQEIIEYCRDEMAAYKVPRSVVFIEELPLSPVGKVLRAKIKELYGQPASPSQSGAILEQN